MSMLITPGVDGMLLCLVICTWSACVAWKNLLEKEFMEKYGNDVLTQYKLPTEEELKQLDRYDEEQEGQADGAEEGDDDDDGDDLYGDD